MLKPRHWHTLVLGLICSTGQAGTNSWTSTGPEGGPVASVAFHPTDDTALLAGSARGVHLSLTTGAFWARMFEGDINDIGTVVFDPSREGRVFALGNSLYRSDDDARTFARAYPFGNVMSMALAKDGVLYLLDMDGRVFRSADAGGQWTQLVVPWANSWPGNISVDPAHSNVVYAAYRGVGLYRSLDSGATWQPPLASGPGTRNDFDMAIRVVVDPTDSDRLLAATYDGLMHSEDGGANWATRLPGWQGFQQMRLLGAFTGFYIGLLIISAMATFWQAGSPYVNFSDNLVLILNGLPTLTNIIPVFLAAFLFLMIIVAFNLFLRGISAPAVKK